MKDVESCVSYACKVSGWSEKIEKFEVHKESYVRVPNRDYGSE